MDLSRTISCYALMMFPPEGNSSFATSYVAAGRPLEGSSVRSEDRCRFSTTCTVGFLDGDISRLQGWPEWLAAVLQAKKLAGSVTHLLSLTLCMIRAGTVVPGRSRDPLNPPVEVVVAKWPVGGTCALPNGRVHGKYHQGSFPWLGEGPLR
jgi:hypothetical protein